MGAKKVAIINTTNMANQGSAGRLSGLLNCLEETIPGVEVTVWHRYYRQDRDTFSAQYIRDYPGLKIRRHPWFNEYGNNGLTAIAALFSFGIFAVKCGLSKLIRQPRVRFARDLEDYQAVLDLNLIEPDKLTDRYDLVSSVGVFFALLNTLSATMTGVPVVICSATIGPYHSRLLRWFARFCLNRVEVITLREKYSLDYLPTLGVTKPQISLSADLAFLLNPWRSEKVGSLVESLRKQAGQTLIGIAPAAMTNSSLSEQDYIRLLTELSDFLVEKYQANLVYITHTYQDNRITDSVCRQVQNKNQVKKSPTLSAPETKAIIGNCDIFICSRFHALVASTSQGVPSLGLVSYSPSKFYGILGDMMDMKNYLLDIQKSFQYTEVLVKLKSTIQEIWENRQQVKTNLQIRAQNVQGRVYLNGKLVDKLIGT